MISPLLLKLLVGLGPIFFEPICPVLPTIPEFGHGSAVSLGIGFLQVSQSFPKLGFSFLNDFSEFLRVFLPESMQPLGSVRNGSIGDPIHHSRIGYRHGLLCLSGPWGCPKSYEYQY